MTHPSLIPYVITEVGATRLVAVAQFTDAHLGGSGRRAESVYFRLP
ncbi:hypothetical protein [Nocardia miyunensis]|nr:hypothetical protein [Nocardia miyunensis]